MATAIGTICAHAFYWAKVLELFVFFPRKDGEPLLSSTCRESQQVLARFPLLVLLLCIGIFFRFYGTPLRYSLGGDSTRDGLVAIEGAKLFQLPLTGAFSSLGPFTFGPWFYYQLIIFHLLFPVSYSSWVYMGIASLMFVIVMYKIGEWLEGKTFGLLVAFLVTFSTSQIATGTELSNPNLIPHSAVR